MVPVLMVFSAQSQVFDNTEHERAQAGVRVALKVAGVVRQFQTDAHDPAASATGLRNRAADYSVSRVNVGVVGAARRPTLWSSAAELSGLQRG